jgi:Cu-Zn family superoxide dismutase
MKKKILSTAAFVCVVAGCASSPDQEQASASAILEPRSGSSVQGKVTFTQTGPDIVRVSGTISGHSKGPKGFHIHDKGDCSDAKGMSTGGHFNPGGHKHGGPYASERHSGDLGNLNFDANGVATFSFVVGDISVSSDREDGIIGRAVIVHATVDDQKTDPTGNAGGRVACGIIKPL